MTATDGVVGSSPRVDMTGSAENRPVRDLEVVIPAYNEVRRLPTTVAAVQAHLARLELDTAIVVVDNGSVDRTVDLIEHLVQGVVPVYVLGCDEQGKGAAVRRGVLTSRAAVVGFQDADLSTPLEALGPVLEALADGADVAIAVRRGAGAVSGRRAMARRAGSFVFSAMAGSLTGTGDSQCGFKFFRKVAADAVFSRARLDGFAFDVEILSIARALGLRVDEVPVIWEDAAGSTFRPFHDGVASFFDLMRVHHRVTGVDMTPASRSVRGLHIVFVNWRDIGHSEAGGAETYAWELARRIAAMGARATYLTAATGGAAAREMLDGVEIVRRGSTLSLYPAALAWLAGHRRSIDAVIDCQNGIPFFSPLAVGRHKTVLLVVHHVHQDQFATRFSPRMAAVGRALEGPISRAVYRNQTIVTVSPSTRSEVRRRLRLRAPVVIIPNGTPEALPTETQRSRIPTIVCLGRLVPHKRVDLLLHAAHALRLRWPEWRIDVAGDGPSLAQLRDLVDRLGLQDVVRLHGRVDEPTKAELLASAWLAVHPSMGEGWGITVMEAAAAGVPSLAFDVPGLRDSIIDGETGWLIPEDGDLAAGIDGALGILQNDAGCWGARAREWAACFSWDDSASRLAGVVVDQIEAAKRRLVNLPELRRTDCACVLEVGAIDATQVGALRDALRRSDVVEVSGDRARALLHCCDERSALAVADRIGLTGDVSVRAADQRDLLTMKDPLTLTPGNAAVARLPAANVSTAVEHSPAAVAK